MLFVDPIRYEPGVYVAVRPKSRRLEANESVTWSLVTR